MDKPKDYLNDAGFMVKTDKNPLTYVLTTAKLDATGQRRLAALSGFHFSLMYQPGMGNNGADALSRRPYSLKTPPGELAQNMPERIEVLYQGVEHQVSGATGAEAIGVSVAGVLRYSYLSQVRNKGLPKLLRRNLKWL